MNGMESSFLKHCREILDTMHLRLYHVLGVTACASNTLGFIANITAHGWSWASVFFGISALIIYLAFYIGLRHGKKEETTLVMIVLTTLIEFPVMCYLYGSGRAVFCIFAVAVYVFFLDRRLRWLFLILSLALNSAGMVLHETWPAHIAKETASGAFATMLSSLIMVMIVTFILLGIIRVMIDIQQDSIMQIGEQLEDVLIHDALTNTYNRQYMYPTFNILKEKGSQITAALLDIDDFKQINDTRGHVFGDEVLVTLAKILMEKTADKGTVFRFGGEEFLVLSGDVSLDEITGIIQCVKKALRDTFGEKNGLTVTFSCGVVACDADDDLETALKEADARLYHAKNSGKDRIVTEGTSLPEAPSRINRMS